jgi:Tol biopolymer transport system component
MRCWLCVVLVAGCGRWGFSTRSGDDAASDGAADTITDAGICHSGAWSTPQLIANTATLSEESDPSISPDELTLYFNSNRSPGVGRAIWQSTRATKTDPFGMPTLVGEFDSPQDDRDPAISADGLTMYFMSTRSGVELIYVATRGTTSDPFVIQGPLTIVNGGATSLAPSLSPDELTLYFTYNQLDIAYATRPDRQSDFTFVRNLAEVNANQSDGDPSISADGLELFFDSFRTGPSAIFVATRASTSEPFSAPTELTALTAVNPSAGRPEISADGRTLYLASSDGTQIDLYSAQRDCR